MPEFETQVEKFARKIIDLHGFRFNEGFSCLIPDDKVYPLNEGLFLWGFNKKRMRFETKIEKFHTASRINRINEMLGVSEKEYKKIYSAIDSYLKSLKKLGFTEIGKGVAIFGRDKLFNVTAEAKIFENNVEALKEFEKITINSQIMKFAEKNNYFKATNKTKSAWDAIFGSSKPSATKAKPKPKAKPATASKRSATLADKFKKMATANKPKTAVKTGSGQPVWTKEVNGLHKTIKTWLNEYSKNGYISFSTRKVKLHDEDAGNYEVNALELNVLGGHKIVFQPIEIGFIGAIGRIDVTHIAPDDNGHKHMMLLIQDSKGKLHWKLWKNLNIGNQLAFNKQMLDDLLNQWIEF